MTDITLEQRARELLAAECRAEKMGPVATAIEQGMYVSGFADIALRAIEAALRLSAGANAVEQLDESEKDVALGQAVEFAEYVERQAKGSMRDAAKRFLSLPYALEIAERLNECPARAAAPRHETGEG